MTAPSMLTAQEARTPEQPTDFEAGYFDYQALSAFRDLRRIHGFEEARQIMADIINSEAEGRKQ